MMKSWISTLLIVLIAMQSVMAVADVHLEHQSSATESSAVQPITDHQIDFELISQPEPANAIDCQHCCHCHSPQFNFLGSLFTDPVLKDGEKHAFDPTNTAPFSLASALFKPPRA